ncbi:general substrate transporter [Aspergillus californicus]
MGSNRVIWAQIFGVLAPSYIVFGYNQSGLGGLVDFPSWVEEFPETDTVNTTGAQKSHNSTVQGAVVASYTIGALFGSLACTWIGNRLGRRRTIFLGACVCFVGQTLECTAYSLAHLVVGRVVLGFGVGVLSATVPVWISECCPPEKRGRNVVLVGMFIALGFATSQWVNYGFYHIENLAASWRGALTIPFFFIFIIMLTVFSLPESPRWLVLSNRSDSARQALATIRRKPVDAPAVIAEINDIELALEEHGNLQLKDIFTMTEEKLFYRFMLCVMLQFFQQMTGGTLISVYTSIIFEDNLNLGASTSKILAACALTWKFLSCFVSFWAIDRLGRRLALMISAGGMATCMVAMAISTYYSSSSHSASIAMAFFVFLYNFFLPVGFLGANFLYTTEVAPSRLRVAMQAISTANQWLWMFVVAMITPVAIADIGWRYYIIYAVIGALVVPSIFLFYPETMGRDLEELDEIFREGSSVFDVVAMSKTLPRRRDLAAVEAEGKVHVEEIS